jgi:Fe-S-cluster containining protein
MIYVSVAEALIIYDHLKTNKLWDETKKRCIDLIKITQKSSPLSWFKMRIECPVLDPKTKMCSAYEVRPPPCSTHFVKSNPDGCDPWSLKPIEYKSAGMTELYDKYEKDISKSLDGNGILSYRLPMVVALLFAEKINSKTKMKANEITSFIFNELK